MLDTHFQLPTSDYLLGLVLDVELLNLMTISRLVKYIDKVPSKNMCIYSLIINIGDACFITPSPAWSIGFIFSFVLFDDTSLKV